VKFAGIFNSFEQVGSDLRFPLEQRLPSSVLETKQKKKKKKEEFRQMDISPNQDSRHVSRDL